MKLEQGDAFEVRNAQWLRERLPHYEPVWSAFIGHDGAGWPCDIPGLDRETERDRRRFYQAHYSLGRSLKKIGELAERVEKSSAEIPDYQSFEVENDRLFNYAAHLGHIRDMFKIIDEALDCGGALYDPMQEFYAQRSHVMHGPRLPAHISDGFLMIPKIGGSNEVFNEWTDKSTWKSVPVKSFVFLRDFVANTTDEVFKLVGQLHGKVFDAAKSKFKKTIIEPKEMVLSADSLSGLTFAPAISAFIPPSGKFRG